MKNTKKLFAILAISLLTTIVFSITACTPTFSSVKTFEKWLNKQPENTLLNPYRVSLKVSDLTGIGKILLSYPSKFIYLDLSGSTVTFIPDEAFIGCVTLAGITIPNSVTKIGEYAAFYNCTSLTSITIPDSVTSIGRSAFSGCKSLASVTIPNSVTSIEGWAFSDCKSLVSVTLPNSVISIGEYAFYVCTSLTTINVDAGNTMYNSQDGVLYNKNKTLLHTYPAGKKETFFAIPDSVTSIGKGAFHDCTSLVSITLPNSVISIGDSAFYDCTSLISVTLPNSVISIGEYAFYDCTSLVSITLPNSVISIGDSAFSGCKSLVSVTIPNSVTSIGRSAFSYCTSLTAINIDAGNIMYNSQDGVLYNKNKTLLHTYPAGKKGTFFAIPDSVTSIGDSAFISCKNLTSITIPDSVTSIGSTAFLGCDSLTSVTFQGMIPLNGFKRSGWFDMFLGDLREKYLAGGRGTYTRASGGETWTKQ